MPKQKRAQGRQKKNWMEGIMKAMNERNLNEGQWEDRKKWSPGVGQRRTIRSLYLKPGRVHACIYVCVCAATLDGRVQNGEILLDVLKNFKLLIQITVH